MRRLLPLLGLLCLCMGATQASAARPLPTPKIIAAYVYADWCTSCKLLSPQLKQARADGAFDQQDVLFVTFDLTDKPRIHQTLMLAQALGLGEYLRAQGSATGYVALLDASTKKEIIRFDKTRSSDAIAKGIAAALAR